jgi:hypothetical protein
MRRRQPVERIDCVLELESYGEVGGEETFHKTEAR